MRVDVHSETIDLDSELNWCPYCDQGASGAEVTFKGGVWHVAVKPCGHLWRSDEGRFALSIRRSYPRTSGYAWFMTRHRDMRNPEGPVYTGLVTERRDRAVFDRMDGTVFGARSSHRAEFHPAW